MKKTNYFAPTIEVVEMVVENGIAASITAGSGVFGMGDADESGAGSNYQDYNDGAAIW